MTILLNDPNFLLISLLIGFLFPVLIILRMLKWNLIRNVELEDVLLTKSVIYLIISRCNRLFTDLIGNIRLLSDCN